MTNANQFPMQNGTSVYDSEYEQARQSPVRSGSTELSAGSNIPAQMPVDRFAAGSNINSNLNPPVDYNPVDRQLDRNGDSTGDSNFGRLLTGLLIGATIGGLASALSSRRTVDVINQSIRGLGNAVKQTADGINQTVKDLGEAVQSVAIGVNETVKDLEGSLKNTAGEATDTLKTTAGAVKNAVSEVDETVKQTTNVITHPGEMLSNVIGSVGSGMMQGATSGSSDQNSESGSVQVGETLYKLVPVNPEQEGVAKES